MIRAIYPVRIQLSRDAGWRMPRDTVKVDRTTRWGNFYRVGGPMCRKMIRRWGHSPRDFRDLDYACADAADAVRRFGAVLAFDEAIWPELRAQLAGLNLACWCSLCERHRHGKLIHLACPDCAPCHVDPLGLIANPEVAVC